jgi:hypothetical protein
MRKCLGANRRFAALSRARSGSIARASGAIQTREDRALACVCAVARQCRRRRRRARPSNASRVSSRRTERAVVCQTATEADTNPENFIGQLKREAIKC